MHAINKNKAKIAPKLVAARRKPSAPALKPITKAPAVHSTEQQREEDELADDVANAQQDHAADVQQANADTVEDTHDAAAVVQNADPVVQAPNAIQVPVAQQVFSPINTAIASDVNDTASISSENFIIGARKAGKKRRVVDHTDTVLVAELCHSKFGYEGDNPMKKRRKNKKRDAAEAVARAAALASAAANTTEDQPPQAPRARMVDGKLVFDKDVEDQADDALNADRADDIVEESQLERHTTSMSYMPEHKRQPKQSRWDAADTELFYQGLSVFGTDFEMISKCIFRGRRQRRAIKLKFTREERANLQKVDAAIKRRMSLGNVDLPPLEEDEETNAAAAADDAESDDEAPFSGEQVAVEPAATQTATEIEQEVKREHAEENDVT